MTAFVEPGKPEALLSRIVASVRMRSSARSLFDPTESAGAFLGKLIETGHDAEAIRLMALLLPSREAVWWACLCVRHLLGKTSATADLEAVWSAARWARDPSVATLQTVRSVVQSAVANEIPLMLAKSATGLATQGAIAEASARMLGDAVLRAASAANAHRAFIAMGLDVSLGKLPWN